jgi:protein required for attachment to host cells
VLEAEPNPPTREQGTDRPGRSFDSASGRPSAVAQTDWHAQAEAEFARTVAQAIETLLSGDAASRVVIVAAPKTLAELRTSLPPAVRERTASEIDKDLTNHPIGDVEKILAGL